MPAAARAISDSPNKVPHVSADAAQAAGIMYVPSVYSLRRKFLGPCPEGGMEGTYTRQM